MNDSNLTIRSKSSEFSLGDVTRYKLCHDGERATLLIIFNTGDSFSYTDVAEIQSILEQMYHYDISEDHLS